MGGYRLYTEEVKKIGIIIFGALLNAIAMNFFLIPANVYASGFAGVAQLVSSIFESFTPFTVSTGILIFLLNVPVTILAWVKIGKAFTIYSFLSVFLLSAFMEVIPVVQLSSDIILNAVFGGVKCDLREAKLSGDVVINATAVFGGIDIFIAEDVVVKIKSFPLFGGVSNNRNNKVFDLFSFISSSLSFLIK